MEERLRNSLIEGEEILWMGSPKFQTLDRTNRTYIIAKAVLTLASVGVFMVSYLDYAIAGGMGVNVTVPVIVAALTALVLMPEIMDAYKLKKALYAVTNRRIISVVNGTVMSVEYSKIQEYAFAEDTDGQISLLCGNKAMACKPRMRRLYTILGARLTEDKSVCESYVLYAIPENNELKQLLKTYIAA